jgi:hypothetical protein
MAPMTMNAVAIVANRRKARIRRISSPFVPT